MRGANAVFCSPLLFLDFEGNGNEENVMREKRNDSDPSDPFGLGEMMTFHVSGAQKILDPFSGLSSAGESDIDFRSDGLDIIIDIFLPPNNGGKTRQKRELRFFRVCSFRKDSFPGPSIPTGISFDGIDISEMFGSLIEFKHSDVADAWTAHFSGRRYIKHYVIHFLSEQVSIGLLATGYELGEVTDV